MFDLDFNGPVNTFTVRLSLSVILRACFYGLRLSPLSTLCTCILLPETDNLPFLNQWKGETDHKNDFMINRNASYEVKPGFKFATPGYADCAMEPR